MGFDAASTFAPGPGPMVQIGGAADLGGDNQLDDMTPDFQQSLVAFWPLDGSDPVFGRWEDQVGTIELASAGGVQTSKAIVGTGKCAVFDQKTNQRLYYSDTPLLRKSGVFAFLCAIQILEFPTDHGWVLMKGVDSEAEYGLKVQKVNDNWFFHAYISTADLHTELNSDLPLYGGLVYTVAFGYDPAGSLYLIVYSSNGSSSNSTASDPPAPGTGVFSMGSDSAYAAPLKCLLDNVSMSSSVITSGDCINLYTGVKDSQAQFGVGPPDGGALSDPPGVSYYDLSTGAQWYKESGTGITGWRQLTNP